MAATTSAAARIGRMTAPSPPAAASPGSPLGDELGVGGTAVGEDRVDADVGVGAAVADGDGLGEATTVNV